jgi:TRAP-type mannitol/chloroaromatic compound transport system permease large subunit
VGAEEIDDYLAGVPQPARDTLAALRRSILALVPDAEQAISYGLGLRWSPARRPVRQPCHHRPMVRVLVPSLVCALLLFVGRLMLTNASVANAAVVAFLGALIFAAFQLWERYRQARRAP